MGAAGGADVTGELRGDTKGARGVDGLALSSVPTECSQSTAATAMAAIQAAIISSIGPRKARRTSTAAPTTRFRLLRLL